MQMRAPRLGPRLVAVPNLGYYTVLLLGAASQGEQKLI